MGTYPQCPYLIKMSTSFKHNHVMYIFGITPFHQTQCCFFPNYFVYAPCLQVRPKFKLFTLIPKYVSHHLVSGFEVKKMNYSREVWIHIQFSLITTLNYSHNVNMLNHIIIVIKTSCGNCKEAHISHVKFNFLIMLRKPMLKCIMGSVGSSVIEACVLKILISQPLLC